MKRISCVLAITESSFLVDLIDVIKINEKDFHNIEMNYLFVEDRYENMENVLTFQFFRIAKVHLLPFIVVVFSFLPKYLYYHIYIFTMVTKYILYCVRRKNIIWNCRIWIRAIKKHSRTREQ